MNAMLSSQYIFDTLPLLASSRMLWWQASIFLSSIRLFWRLIFSNRFIAVYGPPGKYGYRRRISLCVCRIFPIYITIRCQRPLIFPALICAPFQLRLLLILRWCFSCSHFPCTTSEIFRFRREAYLNRLRCHWLASSLFYISFLILSCTSPIFRWRWQDIGASSRRWCSAFHWISYLARLAAGMQMLPGHSVLKCQVISVTYIQISFEIIYLFSWRSDSFIY